MECNQRWHIHCTRVVFDVLIRSHRWTRASLLLLVLALAACAEIPKQRYGIERLRFEGMKELSADSLRACLATEQREKLSLGLGAIVSPSCGDPPFDRKRWSARLFALPWKEWPAYDEALLKLDLDRVERWYQARGFYGIRVLDVRFDPDGARKSDTCEGKDCELEITVNLDEGEPIRIRKLEVVVEGDLTADLKEDILDALPLMKGDIFDEAAFDDAKLQLATVLREVGYPRTAVVGDTVINRGLLVADVKLTITPGDLCHFGNVEVTTKGDVPTAPVIAATLLKRGQPYHESSLLEAQRAIYALGAFSSVVVRGELDGEGPEIPVVIELEARRQSQVLVGAGLLAGSVSSGIAAEEAVSVPQWDVHLLGSYENRNFFGGLRRFRIEERPRLLFLGAFPSVPDDSPRFGNTITANFSQPGVIDPRTNLFVETRWENGPDPFLLFFRNDVGMAIGLERGFFAQLLNVRVAIHQEIMQVARRQPITRNVRGQLNGRWGERLTEMMGETNQPTSFEIPESDRQAVLYDDQESYRLPFFEQRIALDLRDDAANPTKGAYFRVAAHEAVRMWDPSWTYVRLTPEARGYAPVGFGMVLAGRFALGSLHILNRSPKLDDQAKLLGAQSYRLRGGGANSNRGFAAGELGDGLTGGVRRWEASLELRIPLSQNFWIAAFGDMGDVNAGFDVKRTYSRTASVTACEADEQLAATDACGVVTSEINKRNGDFRFAHLNTAVGGGLRYRTIIGPIRLDVGYRPKALAGKSDDDRTMDLGFAKFRGAVHLTIGDSF